MELVERCFVRVVVSWLRRVEEREVKRCVKTDSTVPSHNTAWRGRGRGEGGGEGRREGGGRGKEKGNERRREKKVREGRGRVKKRKRKREREGEGERKRNREEEVKRGEEGGKEGRRGKNQRSCINFVHHTVKKVTKLQCCPAPYLSQFHHLSQPADHPCNSPPSTLKVGVAWGVVKSGQSVVESKCSSMREKF